MSTENPTRGRADGTMMGYRVRWTPPNRNAKRWGRALPGVYDTRLQALQHMQDRGLHSALYSVYSEEDPRPEPGVWPR